MFIYNNLDMETMETCEKIIVKCVLAPLSLGKRRMFIEALGGRRVIAKAVKVFRAFIDHPFSRELKSKPDPSGQIFVECYELLEDADLGTIFGSFKNLDEACFTQEQVIRFCEKYPHKLKPDQVANFFLLKEGRNYFVAIIFVRSNGLSAHFGYLTKDFRRDKRLWPARNGHRIFVPNSCKLVS